MHTHSPPGRLLWGLKERRACEQQQGVPCRVDSTESVRAWTLGSADMGLHASPATQSGGAGGHDASLNFDLWVSEMQLRHHPHLKGPC